MDTTQKSPVGELWGLPSVGAAGPEVPAPRREQAAEAEGAVEADDAPTRPVPLSVSRGRDDLVPPDARVWPTSSLVAMGLAAMMLVAAVAVGGVILSGASVPGPAAVQGSPVALHTPAPAPGVIPAAAAPGAENGPEPGTVTTSCPQEAARTIAEQAEAISVGHSRVVHIAVCRGASGQLYYFGANDRTGLTITLPALRTPDGWTTTNNGVTYVITRSTLRISRGATLLDHQALTTGW